MFVDHADLVAARARWRFVASDWASDEDAPIRDADWSDDMVMWIRRLRALDGS